MIRPIVDYATEIRKANPRGVVAVYIPEYVVGPLVGAAAAQPDRAAAQGPAAVHARRDGDLGALPAAVLGARPASASERERGPRCTPATCAAARPAVLRPRDGRSRDDPAARASARPRGALPGRGAVHRRRRPGRPRRALRRPAWSPRPARPGSSSCGTRCRGSGWSSRSPRAPTATGSGAATPSRCWTPPPTGSPPPCPVAGPGLCGGCDFQHVDPARAAGPQGRRGARAAGPARPARRGRPAGRGLAVEAVPGDENGLRWRTRVQYVGRPTVAAGCASTAPARSCRWTTA